MNKVILTHLRDRIFFGLWENDKPAELAFYDSEPGITLGDIVLARVKDVVPGIRAAFVQLTPSQMAFLPLEEAPEGLRSGDEIAVQVTKEAQKTKDPVVSTKWSLTGRFVVLVTDTQKVSVSTKIHDGAWRAQIQENLQTWLTSEKKTNPAVDCGFIVRTEAYEASCEEILQEAQSLLKDYLRICQAAKTRACYSVLQRSEPAWLSRLLGMTEPVEIVTDLPEIHEQCNQFIAKYGLAFRLSLRLYQDPKYSLAKLYSLDTVLEDALRKNVWLKSGGYLVIEPTEAMVVIDVNTGKAEGKKSKEENILRLNLEAADEVARQMRLRNLSGMILIDFIDMRKAEHDEMLLMHLRGAVKNDPVGVTVVDMTKLGIVECTRRKKAKPLHEQVSGRK